MNILLTHANLRPSVRCDAEVEAGLRELLPFVRIEEARFLIERVPEASPAYRVSAHLVIPGPDLRVEAVDHTPQTALAKAFARLREGAIHRVARRLRKLLGVPRLRAAGHRATAGRN